MNNRDGASTRCCAVCGKEGDVVSLKTCKAFISLSGIVTLNANERMAKAQKTVQTTRAELRDELLFKDPPPKEDCPICFLPMPSKLICCVSLPPATRSSVPNYDFAMSHKKLAYENMEAHYPCCGKSICRVVTKASVSFVIPTDLTKQMKKRFTK